MIFQRFLLHIAKQPDERFDAEQVLWSSGRDRNPIAAANSVVVKLTVVVFHFVLIPRLWY